MAVVRWLGLSGMLLLVGCASTTTTVPPVEDARTDTAPGYEPQLPADVGTAEPGTVQGAGTSEARPNPSAEVPREQHEAIARLERRARQQLAEGQYGAAIDTAERGLRLNRYSANLYYLIAQAYAQQGVSAQARNFARLGLRYVGDNPLLRAELEQLARE
ncbi:tetratricopeptide repeat protein [Simiduia sp. 21SJ11W-1]|uniref:tetratricopeptide repeat protein n=1 Tax=Simiduia sp. 21SJ11W-1 TaxID=2909669 RepID=UPI0020A0C115|nr:tetratricopeptide repeat protein [Simiduia sp. 21SJ11W-1]UTA47495.1 tetratricopeptide repeat protein [Simiduia sp. 21SJ11W-1]